MENSLNCLNLLKKRKKCYDKSGDLHMSDFTFLREDQVFGKNPLDIIKKYGTKCAITDFSILLGGRFFDDDSDISEEKAENDRTGWWWASSSGDGYFASVVSDDGYWHTKCVNCRYIGARPAFSYSSIPSISSKLIRDNNGIKEIEYGE